MLPALPAGDGYVAAMRLGFAGIGGLLVLRLGVAPSAAGGGYGWRRIRVEAPQILLDDLASAVDAPDVEAVSDRSWLLAREVCERLVVVQTDGTLFVAARLAQREDVRAWVGPGGPYTRVLRGALPWRRIGLVGHASSPGRSIRACSVINDGFRPWHPLRPPWPWRRARLRRRPCWLPWQKRLRLPRRPRPCRQLRPGRRPS